MLKNYFLIAWRNLMKRKVYAGINILGLGLGITCSLVVFALTWHLNSFDQFHTKADHIYRVVTDTFEGSREYHTPGVPVVLKEAFVNDFKGIEESVLISGSHNGLITVLAGGGEKYFQESQIGFTTGDFFRVFDREILKGKSDGILHQPNQAVISKAYAEKYFGTADPIGQTIQFQKEDVYVVEAVMADFPDNTDFPFDIFLSYENLREGRERGAWFSIYSDDQFYVVINNPEDVREIEAGIPAFVDKHIGEDFREKRAHKLQPLSDLHFNEKYTNYSFQVISRSIITALYVVALFLLVTASINFVNLSTALSSQRSKEVGLRKVFGGHKGNIISQFLSETGLLTFMAILLSLIATQISLRYLNDFLEVKTNFGIFFSFEGIFLILMMWTTITFMAGFYPSFSISKLNPINAIKSQFQTKKSTSFVLRKGLVLVQFVITQFFIIGTLVLAYQINHLRSADLGFQQDAVASFVIPERNMEKSNLLAERLRNLTSIDHVSLSSFEPSSSSVSSTNVIMTESGEEYTIQIKSADEHYVDTYGLEIKFGEDLIKSDTVTRFLATESFAKKAGFENPEDLLGVYVNIGGTEAPISGVVRDFYTMSLKAEPEPTFILTNPRLYRTVGLKITQSNANMVMEDVEKIFSELYPEFNFEYSFLDEKIAKFYESETKLTSLFTLFSVIAVIVGCIGLYGLVSFLTLLKVKEIGVRKVLGANTGQILLLVSKEYLLLVCVAFILATPLAIYVMNKWLEGFAYRIQISWGLVAMAFLATLLMALLTAGYKSIQAAWANPVHSLKSE
ncbi:ABC transporter permease [Aquiflexum sp.]|uniref:ABC transporter permease n=1 Tax=Aquiflexum sp. TaxID=1872584 RepID=UPI0035936095